MDEINCIICETPIKFPSYIIPEYYDGQLYCKTCQLLLDIKLEKSKVMKYKVAEKQTKPRIAEITVISAIPPYDSTKSESESKKLKES